MGSLGMRSQGDGNVMGDAAKISPHVPSPCTQNPILCLLIIPDCNTMGDAAKTSSLVPSTFAQNAILF
jgi:hypothetical protein